MSNKILDLKLTYRCNNNCKYCCQERKLRTIESDLNVDKICDILENEVDVEKVVLTGGEATLSDSLIEIIELIRNKGINNIQLQSNARRLKDDIFLDKIVNAGVNAFGISLHGCNEKMHESFTGTGGSFHDVILALENLKKYKLPVALNCVITKHNAHSLYEIVEFVDERKYASSIQFAFIHITGKAELGISDFVKITEASDSVRSMLRKVKNTDLRIYTEAIPFCLMEGFEKNVSELKNRENVITYDFRENRDFSESISEVFKKKGPNCGSCLFNSMCDGTWAEYPKLYGFDEFVPVTSFRSEY